MVRNQTVRTRAMVATVRAPTEIQMHGDMGTPVFVGDVPARQNGDSLTLSQIDSPRVLSTALLAQITSRGLSIARRSEAPPARDLGLPPY
jgi:hypothetical protein